LFFIAVLTETKDAIAGKLMDTINRNASVLIVKIFGKNPFRTFLLILVCKFNIWLADQFYNLPDRTLSRNRDYSTALWKAKLAPTNYTYGVQTIQIRGVNKPKKAQNNTLWPIIKKSREWLLAICLF